MNVTDPRAEYDRAYQHYRDHGSDPQTAAQLATKYVSEQAEKKPPQKTSTLKVLLIVAGVFSGLILFLAFIVSGLAPSSTEPKEGGTPVVTTQPAAESPTPSPTPAAVPVPADFVLEVVTLRKQCFGSAGCNVTFQLKPPAYSGPVLADDQMFTVIYQVMGDESGPLTNTFTLRGSNVEYASEETMSTKSSAVVITAKVTQVLPG